MKGSSLLDLVPELDRQGLVRILRSVQARESADDFIQLRLPTEPHYVRLRMQPLESGWQVSIQSVQTDDAIYNLLVARARYEGVFRATDTGIASLDKDHRILANNERFFELLDLRSSFGVSLNEDGLHGRSLLDLCSEESAFEEFSELLRKTGPRSRDVKVRVNWRGRLLLMQVVPTRTPHFGFIGSGLFVRDISAEEKVKEVLQDLELTNKKLSQLAVLDPLTQLLNRRGVEGALASNSALAARTNFDISVLLIDVDDFKEVNTNYGHAAGDEVLVQIGNRIRQNTRETDVVGRIGGDEYLVVLPGTSIEGAAALGNKICEAVRSYPVLYEQNPILSTVSIGAAKVDGSARHIDQLLRATRRAIESSKLNGKSQVSVAEA